LVKFIAEVSSNHDCDIERAYKFIDAAADAKCDAVKFQLFRIESLFAPEILEKSEMHRNRKGWELPIDFLPLLSKRAHEKEIEFSCTPFYLEAVKQLEPYVDFYKIASYELLWDKLLMACAKTGKPIVLSTGMATMAEILHAVEVLRVSGCHSPTLLHCTSAYPTPYQEANLAAIRTIRDATGCNVGWSDHTVQPGVLFRAVHHWGAKVVEFHFDLDGMGEEFSSGHCWMPEQISTVIGDIRKGFKSDGNGVKEPVPSEISDRNWRADPSDGLRPLIEVRKKFQ